MPIYDYLCSNCGQTTEVIHGIDAPGPRFCPACGAEGTLRKAFATPTVHFKGSGWAKKDRSSFSGTRARDGSSSAGEADGAGKGAESSSSSPGDRASTDRASTDRASTDRASTDRASTDSKGGPSATSRKAASAGED